MVDVENDIHLLKAALQRGLAVAFLFKLDDDILEYHFQKVPGTKDRVKSVICKYFSSTIEDKLSIYGSVKSIEKLEKLNLQEKVTENYTVYYDRCGTKLYSEDWRPCFNTISDRKPMQRRIEKMLPDLEEEAKEIAEYDKEEKEEAERMRLEREMLYQQAQKDALERETKAREEAIKKIQELSLAFKGNVKKQPPK